MAASVTQWAISLFCMIWLGKWLCRASISGSEAFLGLYGGYWPRAVTTGSLFTSGCGYSVMNLHRMAAMILV